MDRIQKVHDTIDGYERLLKIVMEHADLNKVCMLTKKEISELYGLSYTGTCKKLGFLMKYDLIKQVKGGFLRTEKKVVQDTPLSLLPKILLLIRENLKCTTALSNKRNCYPYP